MTSLTSLVVARRPARGRHQPKLTDGLEYNGYSNHQINSIVYHPLQPPAEMYKLESASSSSDGQRQFFLSSVLRLRGWLRGLD